jgi:hypothetical protein
MVAVRDRLCVRGMVPRRHTRVKPLVGTGLPRSRSVQPEASRAVQHPLHRCPRCPQGDCRASRDDAARPPRPAGNPQGHTGAGCLQAGRAGAALVRRRRASGPARPATTASRCPRPTAACTRHRISGTNQAAAESRLVQRSVAEGFDLFVEVAGHRRDLRLRQLRDAEGFGELLDSACAAYGQPEAGANPRSSRTRTPSPWTQPGEAS